MATKRKNKYKKEAKKKSILQSLNSPDESKGNIKATLAATGVTLLVGVVGGGFVGSAVGKPALLIGAGISGVGHYTGTPLATMFGLGMMASGGFLSGSKTVSGLEGLDGAKERMKMFTGELKQKLYLDKLKLKKKEPAAEKKAVGEVQYFSYPELAAYYNNNAYLDRIESQIEQPALQNNFAGMSGTLYQPEVSEMNF